MTDELDERIAIMIHDGRIPEKDAIRMAKIVVSTPSRDMDLIDDVLDSLTRKGKRDD